MYERICSFLEQHLRTILNCVVVLAVIFSANVRVSATSKPNGEYTLHEITFRNNHRIYAHVLRSQIRLKDGQKFEPSRLDVGLEHIRSLYGQFGYIQATCAPELVPDEKNHSVSVVVTVDEGRLFFISSASVVGLQADVTGDLGRLSLERGKVYNQRLAELFFKAHAPRGLTKLPPRSRIVFKTENTAGDETTGTVAVTFDFRSADET